MKKNFLIMLLTVFCVSFTFAQTTPDDATVNGFVTSAGTGMEGQYQTYAVVGQVFGAITGEVYEVAEGHAQMQIVADTLLPIILKCGDAINVYPFNSVYTAAKIVEIFGEEGSFDTTLTMQFPNVAEFNYDSVYVLRILGCNCKVKDKDNISYDVLLENNICWTRTNLQSTTTCDNEEIDAKQYSTDATPSLDAATFGYLYTWAEATQDDECDSSYIQGVCPCGWHIPTAEEMAFWLAKSASALRANDPDNWISGLSTNESKFAAQPAGYFNYVANRFEGYTTEADFWYVGEDCTPSAMQILYYCDVPMTLPRNANDALSVRCAKDLNYDYALAIGQISDAGQADVDAPASVDNNNQEIQNLNRDFLSPANTNQPAPNNP